MNSYLEDDYTGVDAVPAAEEPQEIVQEIQVVEESKEPQQQEVVSEKELNFKALREEISREKQERDAERQRYQHELELLKAQMRPREPERSALDGVEDDDILTVGKYKQSIKEHQDRMREQEQAYQLRLSEMEVKLKNPDYDEVMEKFSIPLLQENSDFARAFQAAENKAAFAYQLGKMMKGSQREAQNEPSDAMQKAQRIVDNSRKPGTLSNARGGQPSLSKADYYSSMSDAEFNKLLEKNLAET